MTLKKRYVPPKCSDCGVELLRGASKKGSVRVERRDLGGKRRLHDAVRCEILKARPELTTMQQATLAYVASKGDISFAFPRTGSVSLKKLAGLNLLKVHDSSYGEVRQVSFTVTPKGRSLLKTLPNQGSDLLVDFGWEGR